MTEGATHSYLVHTGNGGSLEDLARLRAVPEYTMQAVAQQTGVPADTLRSWERRHGFPVPVRNVSNRRLYSERDIAAIHWLRDQTDNGQGIREAVAMLLSRRDDNAANPPHVPTETARNADATLLEPFVAALTSSHLDAAQRWWDEMAMAVSAEGLCAGVLLPAWRQIQDTYADGLLARPNMLQAHAFLVRKTAVLLDHAGPDRGQQSICLALGASDDDVTALALATLLSRSGIRIVTPFPLATLSDALAITRDVRPAMTIIVGGPDADAEQLASFARLLPEHDLAAWTPASPHDALPLPPGITRLPTPLLDAVNTICDHVRETIASPSTTGHTLTSG